MVESKNSGWLLSASWSVSHFWGIHTRNLFEFSFSFLTIPVRKTYQNPKKYKLVSLL
jgi:hypothetical protein